MEILARTRPNLPLKPANDARHAIPGGDPADVAALQIARYEVSAASVYLLYVDEGGETIADAWHPDLASALRQAVSEFNAHPRDWVFAPGVSSDFAV